jgi:uncharacterized protein
MPESELRCAKEMAEFIGARHEVIASGELDNPDFTANPRDRCFHCKDGLFSKLSKIALERGYRCVADGSNLDDLSDWRPGRKAAEKAGVRSPLVEAGLSKAEIRELSRTMGLPTWAKPASPCLSSRFPYGVEITRNALKRVETSEEFLRQLGFGELRVRSHGDTARLEVRADELDRLLDRELRVRIAEHLRALGFKHVAVDLEGFKSGSLNE